MTIGFFFTGNNNVLTLHNMIKAVILLNYWDKKINAKQKKWNVNKYDFVSLMTHTRSNKGVLIILQ